MEFLHSIFLIIKKPIRKLFFKQKQKSYEADIAVFNGFKKEEIDLKLKKISKILGEQFKLKFLSERVFIIEKNNFKIYIKLILDKLHLYKLIQRIILLNLRNSKQSSDFSKNGFKVFELVVKNINTRNLEIWPTFGSLLGLVRIKNC